MATYSKEEWTPTLGSYGVKLTAGNYRQTAASGWWTQHTAPSGTTSMDQFWMWLWNTQSSMSWTQAFGTSTSNQFQSYYPSNTPPWLLWAGTLMQDSDKTQGYSSNYGYNWPAGYIDRITY